MKDALAHGRAAAGRGAKGGPFQGVTTPRQLLGFLDLDPGVFA